MYRSSIKALWTHNIKPMLIYVMNGFPGSNREMKQAPVLEIYLKDPNCTLPDLMEVDIQIPLL